MGDLTFDPARYTSAPILTVASAITLAGALVAACPKGAPANVKKSCRKLAAARDAAQSAWSAKQTELRQATGLDGPVIDREADGSWAALRMRLEASALLPAARYPKASRAAELIAWLFGKDGLNFLKEPYPAQWASMNTILQRIDEEGLQGELDALAGPEFLAQIRHVHPRYDAMVKAMLQRDAATGENLLDHVRAVQRAIVDYATKVAATVDEDEPETVTAALEALRSIETHREALARRGATGGKGEPEPAPEPEEPRKPS